VPERGLRGQAVEELTRRSDECVDVVVEAIDRDRCFRRYQPFSTGFSRCPA
jgi:hypothetical protein